MWRGNTPAKAENRTKDMVKILHNVQRNDDAFGQAHVNGGLEKHKEDGEHSGNGSKLVQVKQKDDAL
jgi:hypothetical protein